MRTGPLAAMLVAALACGMPTVPTGQSSLAAPVFGATVTQAAPPPAISGGTLLVSRDGRVAIAADPDRDSVYLVDLRGPALPSTIGLEPGDEPGRLVEDGRGRVHAALRRGGALVTIDLGSRQIVARRPVCAAPRGVDYDPAADVVYVACASGELVTLPAGGGPPTRTVHLDEDLRDVVVLGDHLVVSRFRSAELLAVDAQGNVVERGQPPDSAAGMHPAVAWRTISAPPLDANAASPEPDALVIHQRARGEEVLSIPDPAPAGNYYDPTPAPTPTPGCAGLMVEATVTLFHGAGAVAKASPTLPQMVLPVDLAVSRDGRTLALVAAGNAKTPSLPDVMVLVRDPGGLGGSDGSGCALPAATATVPGEVTAVAMTGRLRELLVQTREPAALFRVSYDTWGQTSVSPPLLLSSDSREDTGHAIFHANAGGFVACASCHVEGGEDGLAWFSPIGSGATEARRTQSLLGTLAGTAPYHWDGDVPDVPSLAHQLLARMGGGGLHADQTAALQSWLFALPAPARPPGDPAAVQRGAALFARDDVGCATCHDGPKLTNNATVDVGTGGAFQVPSLVGVGSRGPYMHDGRAETLAKRFDPSLGGGDRHGHTSQLSGADTDDLVSFLSTL